MAATAKHAAPPVRILIADDSAPFRDQLRNLIQSAGDLELMGEASDEKDLLAMLRKHQPDLLLLNMQFSHRGRPDVLQEIGAAEMPVRTLFFADVLNSQQACDALRRGAQGIFLKESTTEWLFEGIRCVVAGRYWVLRSGVPDLLQALNTLSRNSGEFGLTLREKEIVDLVVAGYSNPDIAQQCSISEGAVKRHMSNIFDKLNVANRVELALFAANHHLNGSAK